MVGEFNLCFPLFLAELYRLQSFIFRKLFPEGNFLLIGCHDKS